MRLQRVQFRGFSRSHNPDRSVSGFDAGLEPVSIVYHPLLALVEVTLTACGSVMLYPASAVASMAPMVGELLPRLEMRQARAANDTERAPEETPSAAAPKAACEQCGDTLSPKQFRAGQKTCSRKCGQALRRKRKT